MRVLNATVEGGAVKYNGVIVPNCPILGEGLGDSSGFIVIAKKDIVYLPKTTPDISALISKLEGLCSAISAITVTTGGIVSSPPLNSGAIDAIKGELASLRGALR